MEETDIKSPLFKKKTMIQQILLLQDDEKGLKCILLDQRSSNQLRDQALVI